MKANIKIIDLKNEKFNFVKFHHFIQKYKLIVLRNIFTEKEILDEVFKFKAKKKKIN